MKGEKSSPIFQRPFAFKPKNLIIKIIIRVKVKQFVLPVKVYILCFQRVKRWTDFSIYTTSFPKKIPHFLKPFGFQLVRAEGMRERGEGVRKYTTGYPLAKS